MVRSKKTLILEAESYRYQEFFSDIAGMDIKVHEDSPDGAINAVRKWLQDMSPQTSLPGPLAIKREYLMFVEALPRLCEETELDRKDLLFADYKALAEGWLGLALSI